MYDSYLLATADIDKPDFKLEVSEDQRKTTLFVTDPLTALFKDGRQLNIRDVFSDQLMYKVTYRKNKSTGKVGASSTDGSATDGPRSKRSNAPSRKSGSPRAT